MERIQREKQAAEALRRRSFKMIPRSLPSMPGLPGQGVMRRLAGMMSRKTKVLQHTRTWSDELFAAPKYSEMVATKSYKASGRHELSFRSGDTLIVLSMAPGSDQPNGWFYARLGKREGLVPRSCAEPRAVET
mmetsp:Transcript_7786/g.19840  ORF Transcript_7786/g.19840 Transcript_7786/m.19840 type:complete len:133 (+) Transcript_7786:188-586(+)